MCCLKKLRICNAKEYKMFKEFVWSNSSGEQKFPMKYSETIEGSLDSEYGREFLTCFSNMRRFNELGTSNLIFTWSNLYSDISSVCCFSVTEYVHDFFSFSEDPQSLKSEYNFLCPEPGNHEDETILFSLNNVETLHAPGIWKCIYFQVLNIIISLKGTRYSHLPNFVNSSSR